MSSGEWADLVTEDAVDKVALYATIGVSICGFSLVLMQFDFISRHLLSPPRLLAKRRGEYAYAISQCCEYTTLMARQHVGGGKKYYDPNLEPLVVEKVDAAEDMDTMIEEILDPKIRSPIVVTIEQDPTDERNPDEYFLYLAFPPNNNDEGGNDRVATPSAPKMYRRVRVPMVAFGQKLAQAFERQMTSTAMCFVADASSGLGSEVLGKVVKDCNHGVAVISNPAWMTSFAQPLSKRCYSREKMERVLFALCRLDAWRVRNSVGDSRTVMFTLPGQGCVPLLLPMVQKVFVHDRHVFVYDGCCASVERGVALQKTESYRRASDELDVVLSTPVVVSATNPLAPLKSLRDLPPVLAQLNSMQASVVEAWMASVDTLLRLKEEEKTNFYAPFVCRMGFLMQRTGLGNGNSDVSELALTNVLQYITGSRSRLLPQGVIDAARESLRDVREKCLAFAKGSELVEKEKVVVEQCVFSHKMILIGDKTLLDTVQPKADWSLKAAKKLKSCMCCVPEGEESDEDEDGIPETTDSRPKDEIDTTIPGVFASAGKPKYMDGKSGFAFDPNMFK